MLFIFCTADGSGPEEITTRINRIKDGDSAEREKFIKDYTPFIIKNASKLTGRYITPGDSDEFSIALIAFNEAIDSFDTVRDAGFISFAKLVIKRRLIDYLRRDGRNDRGINFSQIEDEDGAGIDEKIAGVNEYCIKDDELGRREEVLKLGETLREYKVIFKDLVKECPKHQDTRKLCFEISVNLLGDKTLRSELFARKTLPVKLLAEKCGVSRKTVERHRKYIIALCIILSGDFECLKEYINGI